MIFLAKVHARLMYDEPSKLCSSPCGFMIVFQLYKHIDLPDILNIIGVFVNMPYNVKNNYI